MIRPTLTRAARRGNVIMEFAVGTILLFLLLGGGSDFGRAFYHSNMVVSAARNGTQYGMLSAANASDNAGMQTAALAEPGTTMPGLNATASSYCECSGSSTQVACTATCGTGSTLKKYVEVNTTYAFATLVSWPLIGSSYTLRGKSVVRVQ